MSSHSERRTSPRKRTTKECQSTSKPQEYFSSKKAKAVSTAAAGLSGNDSGHPPTTAISGDLKLLGDWISHSDSNYHHFSPKEAPEIRQALLDWYRINRRKLPWRGDPPPYDGSTANNNNSNNRKPNSDNDNTNNNIQMPQSAYGIWVSEIMCQQTRVAAVVPFWLKWMESFPTVHDLANATEEEVNSHWAGLGFYRRARLLHQASKHIVDQHQGVLPNTVDELIQVPGIGRYTASAIASIAFDVCVPVVDGNVCRLLSRLTGIANHIKAPVLKDKLGWDLAEQIVKAGDGKHAGEVNQAMMELGATFCAPSGTGIDDEDPLKKYYRSTQLGAAYYAYSQQKQTTPSKQIEDLINQTKTTAQSSCAICQDSGVSVVLEQLEATMEDQVSASDQNQYNAARCCGHSVFPIAPPKQSKREEVLAVAVISFLPQSEKDPYWLLVKRPKKGLLAGQWEFPSAIVWSSDTDGKAKRKASSKPKEIEVPSIAASVRQKAVGKLMDDIVYEDEGLRSRINGKTLKKLKGPQLEHIFSHVRHTYAIDYASLNSEELGRSSWESATGRDVRWMRQSDMKQAGVTSGVKKILKVVKEEAQKTKKKQGFFEPKKKK